MAYRDYGGRGSPDRDYDREYGRGPEGGRYRGRDYGPDYERERGAGWEGGRGYDLGDRNPGQGFGGGYGGADYGGYERGAQGYGGGWGRGRYSEPGRYEDEYGGVRRWDYGRYGGRGAYGAGYGGYQGGAYEGVEGAGAYGYGVGAYGAGVAGRYAQTGRQSYIGRGPKGYRRSDERIREDVNERLARHPDVDATDVEVIVNDGEVTLRGVVEDRGAKRLAEDVAEDVFGVSDVHNELKVRHGLFATLTGERADEREVRRAATREGATTAGATGTAATAEANSGRGRTPGAGG